MSKYVLLLGHQLFHPSILKRNMDKSFKDYRVLMIETRELASQFKLHKQRVAHCFSSMRHYALELQEAGLDVQYISINENKKFLDVIESLNQVSEIFYFEWENQSFENSLIEILRKKKVKTTIWPSPQFIHSKQEFKDYLATTKKPFMKTFYEQARRKHNVLVDENGQPFGGQFSYDSENRKKWDLKSLPPVYVRAAGDEIDLQVINDVNTHFADHPGELTTILYSTTREASRERLLYFVKNCLVKFGDFEDSIEPSQEHLFHSVLSADLNMGWITPREVLGTVLGSDVVKQIPINSLEGFVRQVLGWREFVRGIFDNFNERLYSQNVFGANRALAPTWRAGQTGLVPLDDAIKKFNRTAYNHHIERLMIHSNLMNLCEIHPHEAYQFFMEQSIDSYEWVMSPNVMGMGLGSSGDLFATKPYVSGSNYILKMSHYGKGDWCEIWDGLYWRFIAKHEEKFAKNPRMSMMVATLRKMNSAKRERIVGLAENFVERHTLKYKS